MARGYTKQCFSVENREEYDAQGVKSDSQMSHDRAGAPGNIRGSATVAPLAQNIYQSSESDFFENFKIPIFFTKRGRGGLCNVLQSGVKYRDEYIFISNNTWRERSIDITVIRVI